MKIVNIYLFPKFTALQFGFRLITINPNGTWAIQNASHQLFVNVSNSNEDQTLCKITLFLDLYLLHNHQLQCMTSFSCLTYRRRTSCRRSPGTRSDRRSRRIPPCWDIDPHSLHYQPGIRSHLPAKNIPATTESIYYRSQTKFAKVMFLHVSVCPGESPGLHRGGELRGLACLQDNILWGFILRFCDPTPACSCCSLNSCTIHGDTYQHVLWSSRSV